MDSNHPFRSVIYVLQAAGLEVDDDPSPYKLLWQLCSLRGEYMNASVMETAGAHREAARGLIARHTVVQQAGNILTAYIETGQLSLPAHFKTKVSFRAPPVQPAKTTDALRQAPGKKVRQMTRKAEKMAAIEAYAKEHGCTITQATVALM